MFTGIIQAVGQLTDKTAMQGDFRMQFQSASLPMHDVALGDSIAVNGVCLTVIEKLEQGFSADVSSETVSRTSLAKLQRGSSVNLEMALTPTSRLGGHMVSGHVDGLGVVTGRHKDARSERFEIKAPGGLMKYIAEKGSICVDGVSLTVNSVSADRFDLNIVPHTLKHTIMQQYQVGSEVNLEVDLIARYLERLLLFSDDAQAGGITLEKLRDAGFM